MKRENKWKSYMNLFSCHLENLDFILFSDPSMNGYEKMAELILNIDPDLRSCNIDPWDFTTLWGRQMIVTAKSWKVNLRDYSTNLIHAKNMRWAGTVCGAEQHGREELNFRDVMIDPGLPWPKMIVSRNLAPLRFFHDIEMDYDFIEFGWGPSMEAVWGEFQHAFDRITSPPADNSPSLPWWDKQRMKYRYEIIDFLPKI